MLAMDAWDRLFTRVIQCVRDTSHTTAPLPVIRVIQYADAKSHFSHCALSPSATVDNNNVNFCTRVVYFKPSAVQCQVLLYALYRLCTRVLCVMVSAAVHTMSRFYPTHRFSPPLRI